MKKFIITEEERENILNRHKDATKNHYIISEALGGGLDMSSIDRMKAKYPNGINIPKTITAKGGGVFANGIDTINKNDPKIKEILLTISDLLKVSKGKVTVVVSGGASAVGSTSGYNNNSLAARRRDNLINLIKSNWTNPNLVVLPGSTKVGKATVKDSEEAKKEQFVSAQMSGEGSMNVPIKGVEGDNTNVYLPIRNIPKIGGKDKDDIIPIPSKGKLKRVCVKIPEAYLDEFKLKVREFKNENFLASIPYGVYDVK
jgi:hypothetical protein